MDRNLPKVSGMVEGRGQIGSVEMEMDRCTKKLPDPALLHSQ